MHILAAFDKFKDSMTADAACQAAAAGAQTALGEEITITEAPLTDGGEGFCSILTNSAGGHIERHLTSGPLGEEIHAPLGWVDTHKLSATTNELLPFTGRKLAVIEMASVAGLEQVPNDQRHPRNCTTAGVGELIRIAVASEADAILLGIGGSATSDLGLGALEALGITAIARNGQDISNTTPAQWEFIDQFKGAIEIEVPPIYIACDVDNPLLGSRGAAAVYGPQKGMTADEIEPFDDLSRVIATKLCTHCDRPTDLMDVPGSGAAGGLGFGLKVTCRAEFVPGFDLVQSWLDLKNKVLKADLVLTGEGKFDESSLAGKGPYSLLEQADECKKQSIVFAGAVDEAAVDAVAERFHKSAVYTITPENCPLPEALANGARNLEIKVSEVIHSALLHDG
ncbi:MAG: glycerate kinase family protein [Opitutaceae bacterium]